MLNNYSEIEQMQNELQWWGEEKMAAIQSNDLQYVLECKENEQKLIQEITSLMNLK